jgi:hypothetical protein
LGKEGDVNAGYVIRFRVACLIRIHYPNIEDMSDVARGDRIVEDKNSEGASLECSELVEHDRNLDCEQAVNLHWACLIRIDDLARLNR